MDRLKPTVVIERNLKRPMDPLIGKERAEYSGWKLDHSTISGLRHQIVHLSLVISLEPLGRDLESDNDCLHHSSFI